MERHREEVVNVYLAMCLRELGISAAGEQIEVVAGKHAMPDVLLDFKGLRCMIEGKYADVPDAQTVVLAQAVERVEAGIAHMALAVVYPPELRETRQDELAEKLSAVQMKFGLCTIARYVEIEWHHGGVRNVLDLIRRGHAELLEDDVVARSVAALKAGMEGLVSIFFGHPAAVDKIAAHIGITEPETAKKAEGSDDE
ncbi:hypothetical protein KKH27_06970 [bacterium]|nr:hypothetical protein [bacterium]MBU1983467.1 hypothetical protein [bacterium]